MVAGSRGRGGGVPAKGGHDGLILNRWSPYSDCGGRDMILSPPTFHPSPALLSHVSPDRPWGPGRVDLPPLR